MSATQGSAFHLQARSRPDRARRPRFATASRIGAAVVAALALRAAGSARAEEASAPLNYVTVLLGTTLVHQPPSGSPAGWQHDLGPNVGYGRYITPTIALELDVGPTFIRGHYAGFSVLPGVVWSFSTHVYAAARVVVPVDPQVNLALFPGIGLSQAFDSGIGLALELNLSSLVGRGDPDLGVALTGGAAYAF